MSQGIHRLPAIICSVVAFGLGSVRADAQANLLTDLGVGTGYGVNNSGQVVLQNGIYSNGSVTAFPTGFTGAAINASGEVAGGYTAPNIVLACATYSNGTVTNLGVLSGAEDVDTCIAGGINASGAVSGWSETTGGVYTEGIIDVNGAMTGFMGISGPYTQLVSQAYGINDSGQITGTAAANTPCCSYDGFIYDSASMTFTDLGPGTGYAINANGEVAGTFANGSFVYPALPGSTEGIGYAINATGQVVGDVGPNGHAFFFNGVTTDLNALVSPSDPLQPLVTLIDGRGINDSRLILVNGTDSRTQQTHAYLLQGPWIDFAPGALSFPSEQIGTTSSPQSMVVTNAGTASLAIGSISVTGDFAQTNNCGASLSSGGACDVMVAFSPTAGGNLTGSLTVSSGGVPYVIALSGSAPIKVSISASASTVMTGVAVKLTWTGSPGASCTATGGGTSDGWTGTVPASGTQSVKESTAGTYSYGLTCTAGSQTATAQVSVVVTWPVVSASLSASPTTINSGQPTTLTWTSSNASSCSATGGGTSDNWPGTKATSGNEAVTEPFVPATTLTLNFVITCTSSASGKSAQASAKVIENAPVAPTKSGGGGAFDSSSLTCLFGILVLQLLRQQFYLRARKN
jgi:hypothetical protein